MMRLASILCVLVTAAPALAETVIATRTIRPQEIVTAADVRLDDSRVEGAHATLAEVIGQEARVALYPGRAVMVGSVGEPALVDRNQIVELVYFHGGLRIVAEGRSLARGGVGERIRVMNVASRTVLFGTVGADGTILVNQ